MLGDQRSQVFLRLHADMQRGCGHGSRRPGGWHAARSIDSTSKTFCELLGRCNGAAVGDTKLLEAHECPQEQSSL